MSVESTENHSPSYLSIKSSILNDILCLITLGMGLGMIFSYTEDSAVTAIFFITFFLVWGTNVTLAIVFTIRNRKARGLGADYVLTESPITFHLAWVFCIICLFTVEALGDTMGLLAVVTAFGLVCAHIVHIYHCYSTKDEPESANKTSPYGAIHDEISGKWLSYQTDILHIVNHPFFFSPHERSVLDFQRSLSNTNLLRKVAGENSKRFSQYEKSVRNLIFAWEQIHSEEQRVKESSFSEGERKKLATVRALVNIAYSGSGNPHERKIAYSRAVEMLRELVIISPESMEQLESNAGRLALEGT